MIGWTLPTATLETSIMPRPRVPDKDRPTLTERSVRARPNLLDEEKLTRAEGSVEFGTNGKRAGLKTIYSAMMVGNFSPNGPGVPLGAISLGGKWVTSR